MTTGNKVRVAVIGCGAWGRNLVRNFNELGALAAVCDANPSVAGSFPAPSRTWREILDDPSLPAVAIATPAATHGRFAREALLAGKHVFVEKPLALDEDEATELVRVSEETGLTLMVGHLLQYHPAFLRLKELVNEGVLGRIHYLYSNRLNLGKVRREENALWSFAPHDVSMILGLVQREPSRVMATGSAHLSRVIADVTNTHLSFPDGEEAHVFVSWLHPFKEQKLVVVGDKAMAVFDDGQPWSSKLQLYPHRIDWKEGLPVPARAEATPIPIEAAEPLALECRHFLDCAQTGARPRTDGREGLAVLRVLAAAQRSIDADWRRPQEEGLFSAASSAKVTGADLSRAHPDSIIAKDAFVHESAYIDKGAEIGAKTRVWHFSHVLSGVRIGQGCIIGQNAMIGPDVNIGDGCKIQNNVSVYPGVTLEDGVFCGPSCVFTNVLNPRAEVERKNEFRPTLVRRGATIGANATIVCGNTLGEYCFVAAGAVVTKDVPPFAMVAGVPARRIGWVSHACEILGPDLVCPRTGRRYRQTAPERLEEITE